MRTIASIAQEHFGVSTYEEAFDFVLNATQEREPPRTTPFHLSVPYIADNCPELPSEDEIRKAKTKNILHNRMSMNEAFRVRDQVYKIGAEPDIIEEAENLIYLAENSRVRVPKVYRVYPGRPGVPFPEATLVMEYIPGFQLTVNDWMGFTEEERTTLCARVREQFRLLRSIPSEGYYGRVHRQAFGCSMGMFRTNYKQSCGPYKTYEEFTSAVIRAAEANALVSRLQEGEFLSEDQNTVVSEYKQALEISTDRKPVFTHVDPALKNIIFRRIPTTQGHPPDWEVTLIDWAGAGWFPPWVQGASFRQRFAFTDATLKFYADITKVFEDKAYGEMECGADLVRLSSKVWNRIY
ncbi:hypothetical protein COCCADRAFT_2322 [Bipolaris zeicola 26-R-13]|uniref:Aminoglycoside phosphotransferase domain-containing protein n=1 Tax=Cochliobolus carbonum (strain 26-R-13) TaxID=930089 RepID=W6YMI0_COCC2|nr:uncharacterized protein COCCADRAFT_2322 [Bipolaris zeicola 26-R-13]EUC36669.1 hypothetical protein COCCADRAFT_2322 [Bipolaris zeicola 26-R-13]